MRFGSLDNWSDVKKFVSEWDEFGRAERFSEKIRGHGVGVEVLELDDLLFDEVTDEMVADENVARLARDGWGNGKVG